MKGISLKQFCELYGNGYEFIYSLDNQRRTQAEKWSDWHIAADRRTFTELKYALNPDCILFADRNGDRLQLEYIDGIKIHESPVIETEFYFSVICKRGDEVRGFVFLARPEKGA